MTHPKRLGTPTSRAELIVFERDTQIRLPGWKTDGPQHIFEGWKRPLLS
jgi:hypothetical protein